MGIDEQEDSFKLKILLKMILIFYFVKDIFFNFIKNYIFNFIEINKFI